MGESLNVNTFLKLYFRYGLGSDEPQQYQRTRPRGNSGGFVDLGNEYQYGAGGHQASGANEIFAEEQGDKPWYYE